MSAPSVLGRKSRGNSVDQDVEDPGVGHVMGSPRIAKMDLGFGSRGAITMLLCLGFGGVIYSFWFTTVLQNTFSVVIDAGSTGSRVHVFCFDRITSDLCDIDGEPEVFKQTQPGLSSCATEGKSCVEKLLQPLMAAAVAKIPEDMRQGVMLSLRATAGLRLLPGSQAEDVLRETSSFVGSYGFQDGGVEIMGGDDEGKYMWLAINKLRDDLRPEDPAPGGVVFDLGGGSVQIAYSVDPSALGLMSEDRRNEYIREVQLPNRPPVSLYQHSYLGFGLLASRAALLQAAEDGGSPKANPCLPSGADVEYTYAGVKYAGHGTGSMYECIVFIEQMLKTDSKAPCGAGLDCASEGVWGGPGFAQQPIISCSFFYGMLEDIDDARVAERVQVQVNLVPAEYLELATDICPLKETELQRRFPKLRKARRMWLCYDLLYLTELIVQGFGVPGSQNMTATGDIDRNGKRYGASWPLGLALESLQASEREV